MKPILIALVLSAFLLTTGCRRDNNLNIVGAWTCGGAGGMTLYLNSDNNYGVLIGGPTGVQYSRVRYTFTGSTVSFIDNSACSSSQVGTYSYKIFANGSNTMMTLQLVDDPCAQRSNLLPCTYTKQ